MSWSQSRLLRALIFCAVILIVFPLFLKLMKPVLNFLKYLYSIYGAQRPMLSLVIVASIGAILFGAAWWLIGQAYKADHAQTTPRIGAVGIRNAGHVKMKNVRVVDGDFIYDSENTKNFEGEGLELTGRLSPPDRKLEDMAQAIVSKWTSLPIEEQRKRAAIVYEELGKLKGRPDAADQLELKMKKRFPEATVP